MAWKRNIFETCDKIMQAAFRETIRIRDESGITLAKLEKAIEAATDRPEDVSLTRFTIFCWIVEQISASQDGRLTKHQVLKRLKGLNTDEKEIAENVLYYGNENFEDPDSTGYRLSKSLKACWDKAMA